ncbi:MAG: cytochrome c, partial [Woeseiaceae bacterium]
MSKFLYVFSVFIFSMSTHAGNSQKYCGVEAQSCVTYGANVFQARCALCHGTDGLGEGILSLQLKDYPNTNLRDSKVKGHA